MRFFFKAPFRVEHAALEAIRKKAGQDAGTCRLESGGFLAEAAVGDVSVRERADIMYAFSIEGTAIKERMDIYSPESGKESLSASLTLEREAGEAEAKAHIERAFEFYGIAACGKLPGIRSNKENAWEAIKECLERSGFQTKEALGEGTAAFAQAGDKGEAIAVSCAPGGHYFVGVMSAFRISAHNIEYIREKSKRKLAEALAVHKAIEAERIRMALRRSK